MPAAESQSLVATLPLGHPPVRFGRVGVLLVNLGSPAGTDTRSVRRYLKEFLSDRRVIEVPRPVWWLILNGFVLTTRPRKTGHAYGLVWNRERNEAPLVTITRRQAEKLGAALAGDRIVVDWAMRYGAPSVGERLEALKEEGCERILIAPLYPQYAAATTATANDAAFAALGRMRWQPAIRTLPAYFEAPEYIEALSDSIAEGVAALPFKPDVVLTSYHGMPIEYLLKGDMYHCECLKTTRLVRERLGWSKDFLKVTFQSRFGPDEWLKPYTDKTLEELGAAKKKVAVLAPAFSADCIETLEEIAITGHEQFIEAGGGHDDYAYIPCLNDSPGGMKMLEAVVRRELGGWI